MNVELGGGKRLVHEAAVYFNDQPRACRLIVLVSPDSSALRCQGKQRLAARLCAGVA